MAQNSRPRSASSASNKRKNQSQHTHTRSSRQVRTTTPRVLNSDRSVSPGRSTTTPRSQAAGARSSTGSTRNTTGRGSATTRSSRSSARSTQSSRRDTAANNRRRPKKRGGALPKILILLVVAVVLVGGFTALYFSNFFPLTNIQVSGNEKLQSDYILELADVPDDSTFLRTDRDGITERLLAEPWVKSVEVERIFPDTLVLKITEQPVAAVATIVQETATASEQQWIISEDGIWITQMGLESTNTASENNSAGAGVGDGSDETTDSSTDASDNSDAGATTVSTNGGIKINVEEFVEIPKIKDVSAAVQPVAGEQVTDEGIVNALTLLREFSPEMRAMVASISAPSAGRTALTLYNNVVVSFGNAEDIAAKEKAIATLLAEHEGTIISINVHVADRATYRATE